MENSTSSPNVETKSFDVSTDCYTACNKCKKSIKFATGEIFTCNYWFHRCYWGKHDHGKPYCGECIKEYPLYDGRIDKLCPRCQDYVGVFLKYPKFLEILSHLHLICENNNIFDTPVDVDNPIAFDFFEMLYGFDGQPIEEIEKKLNSFDLEKIYKFVIENTKTSNL